MENYFPNLLVSGRSAQRVFEKIVQIETRRHVLIQATSLNNRNGNDTLVHYARHGFVTTKPVLQGRVSPLTRFKK